MPEGMTCYEADEDLCTLKTCLTEGCVLRRVRTRNEQSATNDKTITIELADWLAMIREGNEESVARNDPVIRAHIAKLTEWEKMVRDLAK